MGNEVGRTGFHVTHTKSVGERGAIIDEMMRELSEESIARWAKRNPSIVVEDEHLDIALVNGGDGDLVPCTDPKQILAYGAQRLARLSSPVREGKVDPVTKKTKGGTWTTSMFVLHLPKSMCREVPGFYPVLNKEGKEVGRRSRWVARDRDEALRYFEDAMEFMASQVIPGGWDAVLGADIQFSETTPHIQVLADTFAPDTRPGHEGSLRCDFSRAYGSHRAVRDEHGRQMSGQTKFRKYHADLKDWMVEHGWEVEREVDPLRHDKTETKATYGALKDERREFEERVEQVRGEFEQLAEEALAEEHKRLDEGFAEVRLARKEVEQELKAARDEGRKAGLAEGRAEAKSELETAREELTRASALASEAAQHLASVKTSKPLSGEQARAFFADGVRALAESISKKAADPAVQRMIESAKSAYVTFADSEGFADYAKGVSMIQQETRSRVQQRSESAQQRLDRRVQDAEKALSAAAAEQPKNDGYEM